MKISKLYTIDGITEKGMKRIKEETFSEKFQSNPESNFVEEEDDKIDRSEWDAADDSSDNFDYSKNYDSDIDKDEPYSADNDDKETSSKRKEVMNWLNSSQNKHSVLAYKLYPSISKDGARSKFSKKFREESNGDASYVFSPSEINKLFNLKQSFLDKISESFSLADIFSILNENEIKEVISKTIQNYI